MCKSVYASINKCVKNVYNIYRRRVLKRRDLIKKLEAAGFQFKEHGEITILTRGAVI